METTKKTCPNCARAIISDEEQWLLPGAEVLRICTGCAKQVSKLQKRITLLSIGCLLMLIIVIIGLFGPWYSTEFPDASRFNTHLRIASVTISILSAIIAFVTRHWKTAIGILFAGFLAFIGCSQYLHHTVVRPEIIRQFPNLQENTPENLVAFADAASKATGWGIMVSFAGILGMIVMLGAIYYFKDDLDREVRMIQRECEVKQAASRRRVEN